MLASWKCGAGGHFWFSLIVLNLCYIRKMKKPVEETTFNYIYFAARVSRTDSSWGGPASQIQGWRWRPHHHYRQVNMMSFFCGHTPLFCIYKLLQYPYLVAFFMDLHDETSVVVVFFCMELMVTGRDSSKTLKRDTWWCSVPLISFCRKEKITYLKTSWLNFFPNLKRNF
jgi:hypothetical protein